MFNTSLVSILEKALEGSSLRHSVISNNIANVNTPGFKKSEVDFRDALKRQLEKPAVQRLKQTRLKHLPDKEADLLSGFQVVKESNSSLRTDGNNVDIEMELAGLAENTIYYNSLVQLLSSQISLLKTSINEGR